MTIERIFIRQALFAKQLECKQVEMIAGAGIKDDRYFGRHDEQGQNVTLVEAEEIEVFIREQGLPDDLSITKRNFITRGVRLNQLVGREFMVGNVRLRGVELCEPCESLGKSLAREGLSVAEVVKQLVHKAGLRADVLSSGVITRGAEITLVD
jgi:MOSC domain-containing protein YiiM